METTPCPLCGDDNYSPHLVANDLGLGHEGDFHLVRCSDCGLIYLNPRPTPDEIGRYYEGGYDNFRYDPDEQPSARQLRKTERRRMLLATFRGYPAAGPRRSKAAMLPRYLAFSLKSKNFIYPEYRRDGYLLDVGCGAGKFLSEMADLGWRVAGIDISAEAVSACRARGIEAHRGTLKGCAMPPERFDVVTLRHSIEHVPRPVETLEEAWRILKPGGRVIIETPNIAGLPARVFGRYWFGLEAPRHLVWFSRRTLKLLLDTAGFSDVRVRFKSSGFVIARSLEAVARHGGLRTARLLNQSFLCRTTDLLLRLMKLSDELIAFAVKPGQADQSGRRAR